VLVSQNANDSGGGGLSVSAEDRWENDPEMGSGHVEVGGEPGLEHTNPVTTASISVAVVRLRRSPTAALGGCSASVGTLLDRGPSQMGRYCIGSVTGGIFVIVGRICEGGANQMAQCGAIFSQGSRRGRLRGQKQINQKAHKELPA